MSLKKLSESTMTIEGFGQLRVLSGGDYLVLESDLISLFYADDLSSAKTIHLTDFSKSLFTRGACVENLDYATRTLRVCDLMFLFEIFPSKNVFGVRALLQQQYGYVRGHVAFKNIQETPPQKRRRTQEKGEIHLSSALSYAVTKRDSSYQRLESAICNSAVSVFAGVSSLIADFLDECVARCTSCRSTATNTSQWDVACTECGVGSCCQLTMFSVLIAGTIVRYCETCTSADLSEEQECELMGEWRRFYQDRCECNDDHGDDGVHICDYGQEYLLNIVPNAGKLLMRDVEAIRTKGRKVRIMRPQRYSHMTVLDKSDFMFERSEMLNHDRDIRFRDIDGIARSGSGGDQWLVANKVLLDWARAQSQRFCEKCDNVNKLII